MVRGRLVSRGRVVGFVFGVVCFTFICDISDKTIVMISGVSHSLDTAIGKVYGVGATDSLACNLIMKKFL